LFRGRATLGGNRGAGRGQKASTGGGMKIGGSRARAVLRVQPRGVKKKSCWGGREGQGGGKKGGFGLSRGTNFPSRREKRGGILCQNKQKNERQPEEQDDEAKGTGKRPRKGRFVKKDGKWRDVGTNTVPGKQLWSSKELEFS